MGRNAGRRGCADEKRAPPAKTSRRDWINARVAAKYQRVDHVVVLEEFPRNAAGKTLKRELRAPFLERAREGDLAPWDRACVQLLAFYVPE
jgi:acyl-coenzyme A synthetase/AMP-(fatty) acid ligase